MIRVSEYLEYLDEEFIIEMDDLVLIDWIHSNSRDTVSLPKVVFERLLKGLGYTKNAS